MIAKSSGEIALGKFMFEEVHSHQQGYKGVREEGERCGRQPPHPRFIGRVCRLSKDFGFEQDVELLKGLSKGVTRFVVQAPLAVGWIIH